MKINKEGKTIITVTASVCVLCGVIVSAIFGGSAATVAVWCAAAVITLFCMAFFREPSRELLQDDSLVFSPCDGKVVVCEDVVETEYLGRRCMQVSIFMSLTNIHINWYPVGGKIEYFRHHNGRFMVAWHPKSSDENEHTTTAVSTPKGTIVFRQVAGLVAQRIVSYAVEGQMAVQNAKCGFIKFGSRVDLFLPLDCEILVSLGQKTVGSKTPIARLK